MRSTLTLLCLLLAAGLAAYSLWEADNIGNPSLHPDARAAAMGDAGVASGQRLLSMLLNPANLGVLPAGGSVQGSFNYTMDADNRSIPLFDSFDSVVDEATYADNTNGYGEFAVAAAWGHNFGVRTLYLGLYHTPVVNFDAHYEEEVRTDDNSDDNTYPPVIAWNELDSDGGIGATGATLALQCRRFSWVNWFSAGVSFEMLNGERTWEKRVVWTEAARDSVQTFVLPDEATRTDSDWEGTRLRGGVNVQVNDRLGLAVAYNGKAELDETIETRALTQSLYANGYGNPVKTDATYTIPGSIRAGVHYQPRNQWRTHVNFDAELVMWEDVNDIYENAWRWYVGVEHSVWNTTPLRLGFRWESSPIDNSVAMPTITGGAGFNLPGGVVADVALHYSRRTYHALDLFPDGYYNDVNYADDPSYESKLWNYTVPADRGWENPDKVEESVFGIQTSLCYHF